MTDLAEVTSNSVKFIEQKAVRDLKRQSDIHLYDDIELVNVLQQRKSVIEINWVDRIDFWRQALDLYENSCQEPSFRGTYRRRAI